MKPLILLVLLIDSAMVLAAPKPKIAPRIRWEYAFVSQDISRQIYTGGVDSGVEYGSDLHLPGRPRLFLSRARSADPQIALLSIFSRLGNQGWELVTPPGHNGPTQYIFKRRK